MKLAIPLSLIALAISGCATKKQVDNTPLQETAVVKAEYSVTGLYSPDFHGKQTVLTRDNLRSIREKTTFDSWLLRWANFDEARIADIKQNKSLYVDYDDKEYSECGLSGCNTSFLKEIEGPGIEQDESEDHQSYEEIGCSVSLANNSFDVDKTGRTRTINGFDTQEYKVKWSTEFKDSLGKIDKNVITFDFWTTDQNQSMNQALTTHGQFQTNYANSLDDNHPLMRLLGANGYKAIAAFTGDMDNQEHQFNGEIGRKLAQIKGYPISIKLEWNQKLEACKEQRSSTSGPIDYTQNISDIGSQMLGSLVEKGKETLMEAWMKDPVIRYVYEIKSVSIEQVRDSKFQVPADYKIVNRG
ncbi:hypothetical protein [Psychrobium sp. 1_MG-2023]|uniref:hypothetical protein n=1 Tax=Psychrobium sp. 1_MG-2023 TaxID=3062624 RepID=UPI000C32EEDC|nr:hypothetical protein [Psychrobium sp. 1_MG-2023]MDP2561088.1 hypothetical protein [Psychrobium sp. 1_MG-2023]PKF58377.1 hypothetical protein CW748_04240 [Alteromonadales bacterium alter-6D02]